MAKISISPEEFGDFVVSFLLDKTMYPDEVIPENEQFNKFMKDMKGKGIKSPMIQYYLTMNPNIRLYYKRMKPTFEGDRNSNSVIYLMPQMNKKEKNEKDVIIKRTIKKMLQRESITEKEQNLLLEYIEEEGDNEI